MVAVVAVDNGGEGTCELWPLKGGSGGGYGGVLMANGTSGVSDGQW